MTAEVARSQDGAEIVMWKEPDRKSVKFVAPAG